jgi:predicted outer membrane repeat protein
LQGAINSLSVTGGQVWVAVGTYKPGGNANTNRSMSFSMANSVAIVGGFVGNETLLSQRPAIHPVAGKPSGTILSGNINASPFEGSFHVIKNEANLNASAVLDGVVITGGSANGGSSPDLEDGGMYNGLEGTPIIANCSFQSNFAINKGGGIYTAGSFTLTNCSISGNEAIPGAGIYNEESSPYLLNCSFVSNNGRSGGGMYNEKGNFESISCSFLGNQVIGGDGGAIYNNSGRHNLINCSFQNNQADEKGGALYNNGGSCLLVNCVVFGNNGTNTFFDAGGGDISDFIYAVYSLFENEVTNYQSDPIDPTNLTTTVSPFVSTISVALRANAEAINTGSNDRYTTFTSASSDLAGNPRVVDGTIDMGAVEFPRLRLRTPATHSRRRLSRFP